MRFFVRRRLSLFAVVVLLATACGGSKDSPPGPSGPSGPSVPSGGTPVPASLTAVAGGDQIAPAGSAVAVVPAVVVKDANGAGVNNIEVTFVVTDGGGSVSAATARTNSQGIASAGGWVLGASGAQRLEARVSGLAAVVFQATVQVPVTGVVDTTLAPSGGIIRLTGGKLGGTVLTIPGGAYESTGRWQIKVDSTSPLPALPPGVEASGSMLVIGTDQLRARRLLTLRIPITRRAGYHPVVIMHDPVRAVNEVIPALDADATSILVAGSHFNASLLRSPVASATARVTAHQAAFDLGAVIPATIPVGQLAQIAISGFGPGQGIWPIAEVGSLPFPDGHGLAASLFSIMGRMLGNLNQFVGVKPSPVAGFHLDSATLAAVVVVARRYQRDGLKIAPVFNDIGVILSPMTPARRDSIANINLRAMMFVSKLPQMAMFAKSLTAGSFPPASNAFLTVLGAQPELLQLSDPTKPGVLSDLAINLTGFASRLFRPVADVPQVAAEGIIPIGRSFLLPIEQFDDVFSNLITAISGGPARVPSLASLIGEAQLPSVVVEARNGPGLDWIPVADTLRARMSTFAMRLRCISCSGAVPMDPDPQLQEVVVVDPQTASERGRSRGGGGLSLGFMGGGGGLGSLPDGALRMLAGAGLADIAGTVVSANLPRIFTSLNMPMVKTFSTVLPATQTITPFTNASFTLRGMTLIGSIEWKFGDGTAPVVVGDRDSTHTHQYTTAGTYTVEATSIALGKRVSVATATVTVTETIAWQFTSLTLDSVRNGLPVRNARVRAQYDADQLTLVRALAAPTASQLIYVPSPVADTTMEARRGIFLQSSAANRNTLDSASRPILMGAPIDANVLPLNTGVWNIGISASTTNISASYVPQHIFQVQVLPVTIPPQFVPFPSAIFSKLVIISGNATTVTGKLIFDYLDVEVNWIGDHPVRSLYPFSSRKEYYTFTARRL